MNFKDTVLNYLNEGVVKVANHKLANGIKVNDVIPGWSKLKTPYLWDKLSETEFTNYVSLYIHDTEKRRGKRGYEKISDHVSPIDVKEGYRKFISLIKQEKLMKKGKEIDGSIVRSNIEKNPGMNSNMVISIFLDHAVSDAKKGYTSKSFREALLANSPEGSESHKKYYGE